MVIAVTPKQGDVFQPVVLESVQRMTREGLARLAPTILPLARAEGLDAHARSIEIRLKKPSALSPQP